MTPRQLSKLKRRVYSANYRARREYSDTRELTLEEVLELYASHPYCTYCHRKLTPGTLSLDHVIPLVAGGANLASNITLACRRCNRYKSSITASDFSHFLAALDEAGYLTFFFSHFRPHSFRRR